VEALATIASVSLTRTVDVGYTSIGLLVPTVQVPGMSQTEAMKTVHRASVFALGTPSAKPAPVTALAGTASNSPLAP
jgi:hypothetical protein